MLDPSVASKVLGFNFEYFEELGRFGSQGNRFEVAGILNRNERKIAISLKFSPQTRRFTAAHELGHLVMHPDEKMHRDRPIKGLAGETLSRAPKEAEADHFAACWLMPRNYVRTRLESTFCTKAPFIFDDNAAFYLCRDDPDSLLRADHDSLDQALAIASARSYAGKHFCSLADQFLVSAKSMAIRLMELDLIRN